MGIQTTLRSESDGEVMTDNVVSMFDHNARADALYHALLDTVYERGSGMDAATVIGVIEFLKHEIIAEQTA